jgi:hypothetical protein
VLCLDGDQVWYHACHQRILRNWPPIVSMRQQGTPHSHSKEAWCRDALRLQTD